MNRKMKTIRNILILIAGLVIILAYYLWNGYFLSKEALIYKWEKENHYGHAGKIILDYTTPEGYSMTFVRYEDGVGVVSCNKKGFLWKYNGGEDKYINCLQNDMYTEGMGYQSESISSVYGWTPHEDTEEVFFFMEHDVYGNRCVTDVIPVDRDGFFFKNYEKTNEADTFAGTVFIPYLEGRDEAGNILWRAGPYNLGSAGEYRPVSSTDAAEAVINKIHIYDGKMTFYYDENDESETFDCKEEDGYITCLDYKFKVLDQGHFMYIGSDDKSTFPAGIEEGTFFTSRPDGYPIR
ncbi:MAG: hypothetical protein IJB73_05515 [Firmicutes bacterium]|nr:hypothetical protein [Bacillota bacterium]